MNQKKISKSKKYASGFWILIFIFFILVFIISCEGEMESIKNATNPKDIKAEAIETLAQKIILFGHASVGNNIVDGIQEIMSTDNRFEKINVRKLESDHQISTPGFYHFGVRKNGFPKKKCDHFKQMLIDNGLGGKVDIAFFKLCYVDIEEDANVQEIFDYYVKTMEDVKKEFPNIKILHTTVPLYSHGKGIKGFIKRLIKTDNHNIKRNEFNEKLIEKYNDTDPIYDLASVESSYPDGHRSAFKVKGKEYFSLANEYTYDGGHLNELGRYQAAKNLLKILSEVALN
jgi:predicted GNAT family acetyltransferase